jgi:flagellar hook-associated protein 1 FlgK
MPGTWFGLETARRAMKVNQNALNIVGQNLANASTTGYSRQEAVISATDPYTLPDLSTNPSTPGQLGTGVEVSSIRRVKDEYLDNNVRRSTTDSAYWDDQISVLQRAEASFAEPASDGIGDRITNFFTAWMDLNNTPQDAGIKAAVGQSGNNLASLMSSTYNQLNDVQNSVAVIDDTPAVTGGMLFDQINEANDLLVQIRNLTDSIKKVYAVGQQPNDLLDKRDQALEELSKFGPLGVSFETVEGKPTGELAKLTLFGADVKNADPATLDLTTDGDSITLTAYGSEVINLSENYLDTSQGGSLLGLEKSRQNVIDYKEKLNDISQNLRTMIADAGVDFFTGDLSTGDFKVNTDIIQNPASIDGTLAGNIADLRDTQIDTVDKPYTFEQYYSLLVTQVGGNTKSASDMSDNQTAIKEQITGLRDSVSGVSTDEELTKMTEYQYGYQAAARVISVLDEMLDLLINGLIK